MYSFDAHEGTIFQTKKQSLVAMRLAASSGPEIKKGFLKTIKTF